MGLFDSVAGNTFIKDSIKKGINKGQVSHAYMFEFPYGMVNKDFAIDIARALECENREELLETGVCSCPSCKLLNTGGHPDVIYLTNEKDAKSIGVPFVREKIISTMHTKPYRFRHKVYIIDNGHLLTVQAQNALLRSAEEPPSYVVFLILTEDISLMLPTLLSRCVLYKLQPVTEHEVINHLNDNLRNSSLPVETLAALSSGNTEKAMSLAEDEGFWEMRSTVLNALSNLGKDKENMIDVYFVLESYKDEIHRVIFVVLLFYKDVLAVKSGVSEKLLVMKDMFSLINEQAQIQSFKDIFDKIDAIAEFSTQLKGNTSFTMALESALVKMI